MSVGTEKSVLVYLLEYEIRAYICSLLSYNPIIKQGDSHILATKKSYVYWMISTHSHAMGDFAFGLSPPLWRPQNAINPIIPEFALPGTKDFFY